MVMTQNRVLVECGVNYLQGTVEHLFPPPTTPPAPGGYYFETKYYFEGGKKKERKNNLLTFAPYSTLHFVNSKGSLFACIHAHLL